MKIVFGIACSLLLLSSGIEAANKMRMTKKDRQDLVEILADPMLRMQRSIEQLNEMAQQIQNYIIENVTVNQDDQQAKECCHKLLVHLAEIRIQIDQLTQLVEQQSQVLGYLDDASVGDDEFNSVDDIDDAELSVISWLKTIYREQLRDKFIS